MDVTRIPFNKHVGISRADSGEAATLELAESGHLLNHLNTIHASAQFALGEAASGECLLREFADVLEENTVVAVVRRAEVKYRHPAKGRLRARASIGHEARTQAVEALAKKGRAIIPVNVDVLDPEDKVSMTAIYEWFARRVGTGAPDSA